MIPSFSQFAGQKANQVYQQSLQAAQVLRMCDGKPGDKNAHADAITMSGSQGTLDAVVLTNPDRSQTLVQRQSGPTGQSVISWLDIPPTGGPQALEPSGFEIQVPAGLLNSPAVRLEALTEYGNSAATFLLSDRVYATREMSVEEARNAQMRAEAVLAAFHGM